MGHHGNVVVTGMAAISPAGIGVEALWERARDGKPCGGRITRFDSSKNVSQIAAEVPGFDPVSLGLTAEEADRMDRVTQFSVLAARMAAEDAGLRVQDPSRVGVVVGSAIGGVEFMERVFRAVCKAGDMSKPKQVNVRPDDVNENVYCGFSANSVSAEVARDIGATGVCSTMATGCTAGIDAIGAAADAIEAGMADVMITGGADAPITPIVLTAFDNISCLSRRNSDPTRASRPFDLERDGFLLAEGCGILVLESFEHARRRGAWVYGHILGFASLSNAYHMTSLPADGSALACTLQRALARARICPEEIDYINAHGSSTPQNDRNETSAFKRVFTHQAHKIPISSTKSVIGHTLGAASALECIVCLRALQDAVVPPTANLEIADPDCDLDYVPREPREHKMRAIECNASGFSGIHSSVILAN